MTNRKGFTLIELLAVIVILAVIALIAIPVITNVIDKAKQGALKDSAYGILDAGEMYLAKNMNEGTSDTLEFICSNGKCINGDKEISYKGQIETGRIRIYSDNKIELCITNNKYSALKKVTDKEVKVETGTCKYEELSYDVSALVSKDDYDKVVNELNALKSIGNATAEDILKDKTAVVNGQEINGTLTVNANPILEYINPSTTYDASTYAQKKSFSYKVTKKSNYIIIANTGGLTNAIPTVSVSSGTISLSSSSSTIVNGHGRYIGTAIYTGELEENCTITATGNDVTSLVVYSY